MATPTCPQLLPVDILLDDESDSKRFVLQDPREDTRIELSAAEAMLARLMDGQLTLADIQQVYYQKTGTRFALGEIQGLVDRLDEAYLLAGDRADANRRARIEAYLNNSVRPASHAGAGYLGEEDALREQLAGFFAITEPTADETDSVGHLRGLISPHIDLHRGGPIYARAYREVAQRSNVDLFIVFGTAHGAPRELFSVSRKDFETPLGIVQNDRPLLDRLAKHLGSSVVGRRFNVFGDEQLHRWEHSIEFQAVFLQYILGGRRDFRMVPILVASFDELLSDGILPEESLEVQVFLSALQTAVQDHPGNVCFISAADLAHIGRQFGDPWLLEDARLDDQAEDDRALLDTACRCDANAMFRHVADQQDRRRICGLAPTYMMLQAMGPARGRLLRYGQAVDPDRSSCVSFAGVAYFSDS